MKSKRRGKRKHEESSLGDPSSVSSSKQKAHQPKNAVVTLNELKPGLEYNLVEHKGPIHMPTFVIEVELNGESFQGKE
ncbi:Uncharacterized protein FKW44_018550, partial [Caligus rogercresseyi]